MAKGVNKVFLLGRLGGEPESRQAGSTTVSNFTVATSEKFKTSRESGRRERNGIESLPGDG